MIGTNFPTETSRHWDITVQPTNWQEESGSETFAGIIAKFKASISCPGMTADTDIVGIQFTSGDRNSAATWSYLKPTTDNVELYATEKPAAEFHLRLTEVK